MLQHPQPPKQAQGLSQTADSTPPLNTRTDEAASQSTDPLKLVVKLKPQAAHSSGQSQSCYFASSSSVSSSERNSIDPERTDLMLRTPEIQPGDDLELHES